MNDSQILPDTRIYYKYISVFHLIYADIHHFYKSTYLLGYVLGMAI